MREQNLVLAIEELLEKYTEESGLLVTSITIKSGIIQTNTSKYAVYKLTVTVTSDL